MFFLLRLPFSSWLIHTTGKQKKKKKHKQVRRRRAKRDERQIVDLGVRHGERGRCDEQMSGSIRLRLHAHFLTQAGTLRRQPDPILWKHAIKRNIRLGRHSSLRVNLVALIPGLCSCWPYFHLAWTTRHRTGASAASTFKSLWFDLWMRLPTWNSATSSQWVTGCGATQLDPQTPAHIPGGLPLHRLSITPPTPTDPPPASPSCAHSLSRSFSSACQRLAQH